MTETALLLINSCAVLESLLIKSEWQVEQASSLAVAEQKLQEKTYPLVLVAIKPDQHDALYSLIGQHSSSLWIGLIERDCLASEALRNLLAACFHDFHTFPLDQERLSHSLVMRWEWRSSSGAIAPRCRLSCASSRVRAAPFASCASRSCGCNIVACPCW